MFKFHGFGYLCLSLSVRVFLIFSYVTNLGVQSLVPHAHHSFSYDSMAISLKLHLPTLPTPKPCNYYINSKPHSLIIFFGFAASAALKRFRCSSGIWLSKQCAAPFLIEYNFNAALMCDDVIGFANHSMAEYSAPPPLRGLLSQFIVKPFYIRFYRLLLLEKMI